MGRYYNPATDLRDGNVGRELPGGDYDRLLTQLEPGEHLYIWIDTGGFQTAVYVNSRRDALSAAYVNSKQEYDYQRTIGYLSRRFYGLTDEEHARSGS